VNCSEAIPALQSILEQSWVDESLREFLQAKIVELQAHQRAKAAIQAGPERRNIDDVHVEEEDDDAPEA
jgi:hypothetical protein